MKTILMITVAILSLSGCCSYCNFDKVASDFNTIFIAQYKSGVKETASNWQKIKNYVVKDIQTSESRIENTLADIYRGVDFGGTAERMGFYTKIMDKQIKDGVEQTRSNFKSIARHLCLCKD